MNLKKSDYIKIIKFIFSSGSSFFLDLFLFTIFDKILFQNIYTILFATVFARVLSSLYNYFINSKYVFENKSKSSFYKYYLLVVIQMIISSMLVTVIDKILVFNTTFIKFFVDIIIFIVNYFIQKEVVFK